MQSLSRGFKVTKLLVWSASIDKLRSGPALFSKSSGVVTYSQASSMYP